MVSLVDMKPVPLFRVLWIMGLQLLDYAPAVIGAMPLDTPFDHPHLTRMRVDTHSYFRTILRDKSFISEAKSFFRYITKEDHTSHWNVVRLDTLRENRKSGMALPLNEIFDIIFSI